MSAPENQPSGPPRAESTDQPPPAPVRPAGVSVQAVEPDVGPADLARTSADSTEPADRTGPTEPAGAAESTGRRRGRWGDVDSWGTVLALVLLAVFCLVSVTIRIHSQPGLSILDEAAHIDSVLRAPAVAQSGDVMLPETVQAVQCRGVPALGWEPPPCGVVPTLPDPGYAVGGGGYNTAAAHPPLYYYLTRLAIVPGEWFTDLNQITLMRLTGAFWLALGACLTFVLARQLGARRWAAFGAVGIMVAANWLQQLSAIVNNDAVAVAAGAAFTIMAVAWWPHRRIWWALPVAAVLLMMIKQTFLIAIVVVCLYLLLLEATRRRDGTTARDYFRINGPGIWRAVGVSAVTMAATVATVLVWNWVVRVRAIVAPDDLPIAQWFKTDSLPLEDILSTTLAFSSASESLPIGFPLIPESADLFRIASVCIVVGLTVAAWFGDRRVFAALAASAFGLIAMPWLYVMINFVMSGQFFGLPYRYGFAMFPLAFAAVAAAIRRRIPSVILGVLGAGAMTLTLVNASL